MSLNPHHSGNPNLPPDPREPDRTPGLASMLDPMRGSLVDAPHGVTLILEPLRPWDAIDAWRSLAADEAVNTLVILPPAGPSSIKNAPENATVTVTASDFSTRHRVADTVDGRSGLRTDHLEQGGWMIAIEGPIEPSDAAAIERALDLDQSPLDAEVRAMAAIRITDGRMLEAHARHREIAERFIAQAFRRYVANVRGSTVSQIASPAPGLMARLTDRYAEFVVRPIETEVYSTSVDIGVSRHDETGAILPADHSLIYDLYSNTWHGE